MRRNPTMAAIVILLLACGIATNTLLFSALNVLNLKQLPVPRPDELVQFTIAQIAVPTVPLKTFALRAYTSTRGKAKSLSTVFGLSELRVVCNNPNNPSSGEQVTLALATGNFFNSFGVGARYGRVLVDEDDNPAAPGAIPGVLGYS